MSYGGHNYQAWNASLDIGERCSIDPYFTAIEREADMQIVLAWLDEDFVSRKKGEPVIGRTSQV